MGYHGTLEGTKHAALEKEKSEVFHKRMKRRKHFLVKGLEHKKGLFAENVAKSTRKVAYVSYSMMYQKDCV